jgi:hypothetical protein
VSEAKAAHPSFAGHNRRLNWMGEDFAHSGSVEANGETRPPCPARAPDSTRGQRPRKTNPETDRPWRGRTDYFVRFAVHSRSKRSL